MPKTLSQIAVKGNDSYTSRSLFVLLFIALIVLFFTACSHQGEVCQEPDWYEIGRQDGTGGKILPTARKIEAQCKGTDVSLNEALYNNGFDFGAAQYCSKENGFEMGHLGKTIISICPIMQRDEFLLSYKQGARLAEIESARTEINRKVLTLEANLNDKTIDLAKRGLMNGEKLELQTKEDLLKEEANNISSALSNVRK